MFVAFVVARALAIAAAGLKRRVSSRVAKEMGIAKNSFVAMKLELASLQSVKDFVANLRLFLPARPISHLICNAAVYKPTDPEPT